MTELRARDRAGFDMLCDTLSSNLLCVQVINSRCSDGFQTRPFLLKFFDWQQELFRGRWEHFLSSRWSDLRKPFLD